jgi:superfamily II DNA/RNA helicase
MYIYFVRLFELGFSVQLHEILHRLSQSRQTMLFSATLPQSLVDFAKAGLHDPTLVRLDVDTKISTDLEVNSCLFTRLTLNCYFRFVINKNLNV